MHPENRNARRGFLRWTAGTSLLAPMALAGTRLGLAAPSAGIQGAQDVFDLAELVRALQLAGAPSLRTLDRSFVLREGASNAPVVSGGPQ